MKKQATQEQLKQWDDLETRFETLQDACVAYHRDAWETMKDLPNRATLWMAVDQLLRNAMYLAAMGRNVKGVGVRDTLVAKAEMLGRARTLRDIGIIPTDEFNDWAELAEVAADLGALNIRIYGGR